MVQDPIQRKMAMGILKRRLVMLAVLAFIMVGGTLFYYSLGQDSVSIHVIFAAILGVSLSVMIGGGLMALGFFSERSGLDDEVASKADLNPDDDDDADSEEAPHH
ncbi:hypothetical protein [Govanella unica]|uniref:Uncharacterized protein n=1 Tax=Govanella unica TaxID=2975056 RepID=A0A9X3Z7Q4_9PROT|nr:hypothetical protein [Govania unica]MDA5194386.1 hypothetical protein [Govania unica]